LLRTIDALSSKGFALFLQKDASTAGANDRVVVPIFSREAGLAPDVSDLLPHLTGRFEGVADLVPAASIREQIGRMKTSLHRRKLKQVVFVIDDLDSFDAPFLRERLNALCRNYHVETSVIFSCQEANAARFFPQGSRFLDRCCERVAMPACPTDGIPALMSDRLAQHGKRLADQLAALAGNPLAATPYYVMAVLEHLRHVSTFATLAADVARLAAAGSLADLHEAMMRHRLEVADPPTGELLRQALRLLLATRFGLREEDLRALLAAAGERLISFQWAPVYGALKGLLREYRGRLTFRHRFTASAARRPLEADEALAAKREAICRHFASDLGDELSLCEYAAQAGRLAAPVQREALLGAPDDLERLTAADWTIFKALIGHAVGDDIDRSALFRRRELYAGNLRLLGLLAWVLQETAADDRGRRQQGLALLAVLAHRQGAEDNLALWFAARRVNHTNSTLTTIALCCMWLWLMCIPHRIRKRNKELLLGQ
jgi:hypothetical protein